MSTPVPGGSPDADDFVYDEMSYFSENCDEYGLELPDDLVVQRVDHALPDGRTLSALRWGDGSPRLVLVHGGAQNAHTWDTVALASWPVPVLAIDLPGHGESDNTLPAGKITVTTYAKALLKALDALGIDPTRRAETVSVAEWVALARLLGR